jgi:CHAT domain-containing protein
MSPAAAKRTRKRVPAPVATAARTGRKPPQRRGGGKPSSSPGVVHLKIDVEWADIVKADGDVFVVGHYVGVLPQNAELALDIALSGTKDPSRLVLTDLTRRGAIRGALGDVMFFPRADGKQIVLAGMGRPGLFGEAQLKKLARSVTETLGRLMKGPTICAVLIGSGFGNLQVQESVTGLLAGIAEALAADPGLEVGRLRIVERNLDKAYEILGTLIDSADLLNKERGLKIQVVPDVVERDAAGGVIPIPFGFSLMLASLAQACFEGKGSRLHRTAEALVAELPEHLRDEVRKDLQKRGSERNLRRLGLKFKLGQEDLPRAGEIADRVSFSQDGTTVRTAAITNMTTVTERALAMQFAWIDRIVDDLYAALPDGVEERSVKAYGHLIHPELRDKLQSEGPLVIEVDRTLARVPWEMIRDSSPGRLPLAVHRPLARQLRTTYSPRISDPASPDRLKALVIGDPDDSLEYARAEAQAVAEILGRRGIDVVVRLGPPDELRLGKYGADPADLFDVITLLQSGEFDLVHYSGHAMFDPEYPDRSGWVFANDEVFTASKLENVDRPPRLIVANACISAALSPGIANPAGAQPQARRPGDARIVASLADEFFRRGVADYIGTAWEVAELPAKIFAETFYTSLLGDQPAGRAANGATLGTAVQEARKALYEQRGKWGENGTVWAAYQHYGDPTRTLRK